MTLRGFGPTPQPAPPKVNAATVPIGDTDLSAQHADLMGVFRGGRSYGKLYTTDSNNGDVNEWNLENAATAPSGLLEDATFVQNFAPAGVSDLQGIFWASNGNAMWLIDQGNDEILRFSVSSDWDISSASLAESASVIPDNSFGLTIGDSDSKMYVCNEVDEEIQQYNGDLFDVSTLSLENTEFVGDDQMFGITISRDGTLLATVSGAVPNIRFFELDTAWDISTISNNFQVPLGSTILVGDLQPSAISFGILGDSTENDGELIWVDRALQLAYRQIRPLKYQTR